MQCQAKLQPRILESPLQLPCNEDDRLYDPLFPPQSGAVLLLDCAIAIFVRAPASVLQYPGASTRGARPDKETILS